MNINLLSLLFILIIFLVIICFWRFRESFIILTDQLGGTVSTKIIFDDSSSTVVRKLSGNNGKTIILLHNSPFDDEIWYSLYMYTQKNLRDGKKIPTLISYDLRGHGKSWVQVPARYNDAVLANTAWPIETFSDDLYQIYKRYGGGSKIVLAGYGFGGAVAQEYALTHPETIAELYILQCSLSPLMDASDQEISYLSQWISRHPNVTYLTMEQSFVQKNICKWFQNKDPRICPYLENAQDTVNTFATFEYLLAEKMFREADSATFLQVDKIVTINDFRPRWQNIKVDFPIIMLSGDQDHYVSKDVLKDELKILGKASPKVKGYLVEGKHGFVLVQPEYISELLDGKDMSKNHLAVESFT